MSRITQMDDATQVSHNGNPVGMLGSLSPVAQSAVDIRRKCGSAIAAVSGAQFPPVDAALAGQLRRDRLIKKRTHDQYRDQQWADHLGQQPL